MITTECNRVNGIAPVERAATCHGAATRSPASSHAVCPLQLQRCKPLFAGCGWHLFVPLELRSSRQRATRAGLPQQSPPMGCGPATLRCHSTSDEVTQGGRGDEMHSQLATRWRPPVLRSAPAPPHCAATQRRGGRCRCGGPAAPRRAASRATETARPPAAQSVREGGDGVRPALTCKNSGSQPCHHCSPPCRPQSADTCPSSKQANKLQHPNRRHLHEAVGHAAVLLRPPLATKLLVHVARLRRQGSSRRGMSFGIWRGWSAVAATSHAAAYTRQVRQVRGAGHARSPCLGATPGSAGRPRSHSCGTAAPTCLDNVHRCGGGGTGQSRQHGAHKVKQRALLQQCNWEGRVGGQAAVCIVCLCQGQAHLLAC